MARDADQQIKDSSLVCGIHTLIYLIHTPRRERSDGSEWGAFGYTSSPKRNHCQFLKGHHVKSSSHGSLSTTLFERIKFGQLLCLPVLHHNAKTVVEKIIFAIPRVEFYVSSESKPFKVGWEAKNSTYVQSFLNAMSDLPSGKFWYQII